jgi:hypothetical protein
VIRAARLVRAPGRCGQANQFSLFKKNKMIWQSSLLHPRRPRAK